MGYGRWGGDLSTAEWGCLAWPLRQPVSAGCTQWLCERRLWLVTKALYKLTTFYLYLYLGTGDLTLYCKI